MTYKHLAILCVLATIALMIAWDIVALVAGQLQTASWCDAFRDLNKSSGGLLGMLAIAVLVHVLCNQWFPAAWGGPK